MLESLTCVHKKLVGVESRLKGHPTVCPIRCHQAEHRANQTELIRISTDLIRISTDLIRISTDLAPLLCICRSLRSSMWRQCLKQRQT